MGLGTVIALAKIGQTGYYKAKKLFRSAEERAADETRPVAPCKQSKQVRVEARLHAIKNAEDKAKHDPSLSDKERKELVGATERFKRNNEAVEYARLSSSVYDRSDPKLEKEGRDPPAPPDGWKAVDPKELGVDPKLLKSGPGYRAEIYQNEFGMKPQYVVAYRGTEPKAGQHDINVDIQNGVGKSTESYASAMMLADKLADKGIDFAVTGHSLGGGLAQAAGTASGANGFMFNSAGAHPNVVGGPIAKNFKQFRAPCDPLTGASGMNKGKTDFKERKDSAAQQPIDNSNADKDVSILETLKQVKNHAGDALQNYKDYGWVAPPNSGEMHQVSASFDDVGNEVPCSDLGGQHSVTNLVNGMEREKRTDIHELQKYDCAKVQ